MKNAFYHRLYDVLLLSGVPIEIAEKAKNPDAVTEADVEEVRELACKLIDETKFKLHNINTMTITVGGIQDAEKMEEIQNQPKQPKV